MDMIYYTGKFTRNIAHQFYMNLTETNVISCETIPEGIGHFHMDILNTFWKRL
uniref:Uncharacterized protein n=1 Tax=Rhizophora mucronata TaxID=61149 RepID=A0A2P2IQX7_RHIMU